MANTQNYPLIVTKYPPYLFHYLCKTQISLGIRPVWSESAVSARWGAKVPRLLHADSEDSDQTGRMPSLIWVVAGRTGHFVGFVMLWLFLIFWNSLTVFEEEKKKIFCQKFRAWLDRIDWENLPLHYPIKSVDLSLQHKKCLSLAFVSSRGIQRLLLDINDFKGVESIKIKQKMLSENLPIH